MRKDETTSASGSRAAQRRIAEGECSSTLTSLIVVTSVLRACFTELIPIAGSAAWWMLPVCLLPGLAMYAALRLLMHSTGTETISTCVRLLLGRIGACVFSVFKTLLMLTEGFLSAYTLRRLFTETISTEGTPLTITLLIGLAFFFCENREGLPRTVFFLRRLLLIMLASAAVNWLFMVRTDCFYPLAGDGKPALLRAFRQCFSIGWPLVLYLDDQPNSSGKAYSLRPLVPCAICCLVAALVVSNLPHGMLTAMREWSGRLRPITDYQFSAVRMMTYLLFLAAFFLTAVGCIQRSANAFAKGSFSVRFRVLIVVVCAAQLVVGDELLPIMTKLSAYGLYPSILLAALCLCMTLFSQGRKERLQ